MEQFSRNIIHLTANPFFYDTKKSCRPIQKESFDLAVTQGK